MSKINIKIKELEKINKKGYQCSKLVLLFEGESVNPSFINSFRRILFNDIPTYAFSADNIDITKNTSVFDNDEMRCRLSQLTIPDINVPVEYLDQKYYLNNNQDEKHPNDKEIIELILNITNDTNENMNVTTNNAKIYINGDLIQKFNKDFPHLLIQLKPKQEFYCRCVGKLGVGYINNIWSGVANAFYDVDDNNEHKYKFTLLSQGQLTEYELMKRSCIYIKHELKRVRDIILMVYKDNKLENINSLKIKLEKVNYTVGAVINEFLQLHNQITFSSIIKPDHLVNEIVLTFFVIKNVKPLDVLFEVFDDLDKLYADVHKQLISIDK